MKPINDWTQIEKLLILEMKQRERRTMWMVRTVVLVALALVALSFFGCSTRELLRDKRADRDIWYAREVLLPLVGTSEDFWNVTVTDAQWTLTDDGPVTTSLRSVHIGRGARLDARENRGWVEALIGAVAGWITGRFGP